jgi:hypothetical protein
MTSDQAARLLSIVDRLARAMPINPLVIELHSLVREITQAKRAPTVDKAPTPGRTKQAAIRRKRGT